MLESRIERQTVQLAKQYLGVDSLKLTGDKGVPDRLFFIYGGTPVFIEFKRPGGRASPRQEWWVQRLAESGYQVYIMDSVREAFALLIDETAKVRGDDLPGIIRAEEKLATL